MRQTSFNFIKNYKKEFGGSLLEGRRKSRRPLSTKHPVHLILKSSFKGLFNPSNRSLHELLHTQAKKFGVKIYDLALNWSHIHMVIHLKNRADYLKFIRAVTSIIAARAKAFNNTLENIFNLRPFTRILNWGRDFKNALNYQIINQLESVRQIKRSKTKTRAKSEVIRLNKISA